MCLHTWREELRERKMKTFNLVVVFFPVCHLSAEFKVRKFTLKHSSRNKHRTRLSSIYK